MPSLPNFAQALFSKPFKGLKWLLFALVPLLLGLAMETEMLFPGWAEKRAASFQKIYLEKERELNRLMSGFLKDPILGETGDPSRLWDILNSQKTDDPSLALYVYYGDSLCCWNNHVIPVESKLAQISPDPSFHKYANVWAVNRQISFGKITVLGLIPIKWVYPIENNLLNNGFPSDFGLPPTVQISRNVQYDCYPIFDSRQNYLFSLVLAPGSGYDKANTEYPAILYLISLFFLLLLPLRALHDTAPEKRDRMVLLSIAGLWVVRILMQWFSFPRVFYRLSFFGPDYLAIPPLFPSIGDLFLSFLFLFFGVLYFYSGFTIPRPSSETESSKQLPAKFFIACYLLFLFLFFLGFLEITRSIVTNSEFALQSDQIQVITLYGVTVYLVVGLFFAAFWLLFDKLLIYCRSIVPFSQFLRWFLAFTLLSILISSWFSPLQGAIILLFWIFWGLLMGWLRLARSEPLSYAVVVFGVALSSLFSTLYIWTCTEEKKREERHVLMLDLATERDYIAEYLLTDSLITGDMPRDTVLASKVNLAVVDVDDIRRYIQRRYLYDGYWDKYDMQIVVCGPADTLVVDELSCNCFDFFKEEFSTRGSPVLGTPFSFLQNRNGQVTYLGWIDFSVGPKLSGRSFFLELTSKFRVSELGYPELLMDSKSPQRSFLAAYSYAKYHNGMLVDRLGDFDYNLKLDYGDSLHPGVFEEVRDEVYRHTYYLADPTGSTVIILTDKYLRTYDVLISFSHIFMFYFLVVSLLTFLFRLPFLRSGIVMDFRTKIQFSIVSVVIFGLSLIMGGTLAFLIWQHNSKHEEIITDKMQSISLDLGRHLGPYVWANPLRYQEEIRTALVWLANVYFVDVNLYSVDGRLVASSRPEVFQRGLLSSHMNAFIYNRLIRERAYQVTTREEIGSLKYLSAYMPLINDSFEALGVLNVPYFTKQESLTREISTLVAAVINLYVLLFLVTVVISVLLSRQITMPLQMIQQQFSRIRLGHANERLVYEQNDEIKGLVSEYNRMVDELAKNVEKLARSERESAWREMAQQVAHEIKNPLTPMKLSIQHIHRAWASDDERFPVMFPKFSQRLVDQIDQLSDIATAFSHFASIPFVQVEPFRLKEVVSEAVDLFTYDPVVINTLYNDCDELLVMADRKQMHRLFVNLLKNALQAVPPERNPIIEVELSHIETSLLVRVTDNGTGIDDSVVDKIFQPNFTTKTSGMGLGLAIVKNIAETAGGKVSFETTHDQGTTFWVELPVWVG